MNARMMIESEAVAPRLAGVFPGFGHSSPGDMVCDVREAIDRRVVDGFIEAEESDGWAEHIEQRLLEHARDARVRHLVRMGSKGR